MGSQKQTERTRSCLLFLPAAVLLAFDVVTILASIPIITEAREARRTPGESLFGMWGFSPMLGVVFGAMLTAGIACVLALVSLLFAGFAGSLPRWMRWALGIAGVSAAVLHLLLVAVLM